MLEESIKKCRSLRRQHFDGAPRQKVSVELYQPTFTLSTPYSTVKPTIAHTISTASGAISSIAKIGDSLMVGSCCSQQPEYNRRGELELIDTQDGIQVTSLEGHAVEGQGRTVSAVSKMDHFFVSAGYDGTVAKWQGVELMSRTRVSSKPILSMASNSRLVACGSAAGQLAIIGDEMHILNTFPGSPIVGANWVDILNVSNQDPNLIYSGTAYSTVHKAGILEEWDGERRTLCRQLLSLPPHRGLSAVCVTGDDTCIIAATGSVIHERPDIVGDALIRLVDPKSPTVQTILTDMHDVDCIVSCPHSRLFTIGDAQDHRWHAYDLAMPNVPVQSGRCAESDNCDDTIALCFSPDGHSLYSGGHDGLLYKTDLSGDGTVWSILMASSITTIMADDGRYECIVGTEGGAVQLVGH